MKHSYRVKLVLDAPVSTCVAAYIDAEHFVFLHRKFTAKYTIVGYLDKVRLKKRIRQYWNFFGYYAGHENTAEYIPPATFLHYDFTPAPFWFPSIHHILTIKSTLNYYPDNSGKMTVSDTLFEMDLPFWLYPFRKLLEIGLARVKLNVSDEDMSMIVRRAKLFGRYNIGDYLNKNQFLLHKDQFVELFADTNKT